jgi:hypothetical protein
MPCTFEPNVVMNFSLGVFAERFFFFVFFLLITEFKSRCKMSELCLEKTVGLTVELTAAGGPPEEGPLVRAEQKGADLDKVAFLHNPKVVCLVCLVCLLPPAIFILNLWFSALSTLKSAAFPM